MCPSTPTPTSPHPEAMFNNTPVYTAMGVVFTPFNDPCMTEGRMMLHDNCVDKPTPGEPAVESSHAALSNYSILVVPQT